MLSTGTVWIKTLEGALTAGASDMIVRGIRGELYPVRADIFEATYEAVRQKRRHVCAQCNAGFGSSKHQACIAARKRPLRVGTAGDGDPR